MNMCVYRCPNFYGMVHEHIFQSNAQEVVKLICGKPAINHLNS